MAFTVVYAGEKSPESYAKSLFLAGPTPRSADVPSWRPQALQMLRELGYDGVVFVPEERSGAAQYSYIGRFEWELYCRSVADCIMFWIPRDMAAMPALTTNDEWGADKASGKVVLGTPRHADHVRYQQLYADLLYVPQAETLQATIALALKHIGAGALRSGGERDVPLHIWLTPSFQQWYAALCAAGNRLEGARLEWNFRVGPDRRTVLFWVLHVDIFVAAEDRHKANEVILGRPDVSAVLLYQQAAHIDDSLVVLVREFRSTVSNSDGFVYELPGGSSFGSEDPLQVAVDEVRQETGIGIGRTRLMRQSVRQVAATLPVHRCHFFSVELTDTELQQLQAQAGQVHGESADGERTCVEVMTLGAIRRSESVDWSMLGMILQVLS